MRTIRLARRNRTALAFLLSYVLVMAIPFLVSVLYFYPGMRSTLIDGAKERANSSIRQTSENVEEQLANVVSMPKFIFENKRIILRNVMSDPLALKQAKQDLEQMIMTNTFISFLYLYIRDSDYFIGANASSFYISDIYRYSGLYQTRFGDWDAQHLRAVMNSTDKLAAVPAMPAMIDGKLYNEMLLFLAPVPAGRFASATSLICVPAESLSAAIDATQDEGAVYLFWDQTGAPLYATSAIGGDDKSAVTELVNASRAGTLELELSNGANLLSWHTSDKYGWRCAQVLPMKAILGETYALQHRSTVIMLCVLVASIIIITLAMRLNYLPIKRLARLAQGEPKEGYGDDFAAIQQLLDRLTSENDQLGERLNQAEPQAREALIAQLFGGNVAEQTEAISRAELFGLSLHAPGYRVLLAEYADPQTADNACANLNAADLENDGLVAAQVDMQDRVALLLGTDNDMPVSAMESYLAGAKYAAYGMRVTAPEQISLSYSAACAALDTLHTAGEERRVIRYDDLPERTFNPRSYPLEVMQSLETAIYHGNAERFEELLTQLESLIMLEGAPPYFTRSVYFNVINLLMSGLARHLGEDNALVREIGLRSMLNHYTVPEMVHIMRMTSGQLKRRMQENARKNTPVTDALDYIEKGISSPTLSLQEVADHVGMSASAFSRSFKDKVGRNFKEYVDAARILRAKALLGGADMPIEQIAASVGYDTLTSFYRMFKKYVGTAPGEYRQAQAQSRLPKNGEPVENG